MDKVVFVISHKYFRGYHSYLKYYIDNIFTFYPDSLVIVVDNNSVYKEDVFNTIPPSDNIVFLDNDIPCKFEIGAYNVGIRYLQELNLLEKYEYVFFTQDTYILKNKYDINILRNSNIMAAAIIGWPNDLEKEDVMRPTLGIIGLLDKLDQTNLCWCNSFVLSSKIVSTYHYYTRDLVLTTRHESEASERYLGRILYALNNDANYSVDGGDNNFTSDGIRYDCHSVNPYWEIDKFFCKVAQQKNETTQNR